MKTRKLKALFLNEDWLIVALGFVVLALIAFAPSFMIHIKMLNVETLHTTSGWIDAAYTFVFLFLIFIFCVLWLKNTP